MTTAPPDAVPSGRLELTWTNKGQRLLSHEDGTYEWTSPGDFRVAEVRLLHGVSTVGDVLADLDRAKDNLLIRGDALHALTSLSSIPEFRDEYLGKVKLAYIDPPFNTGQAFAQYDDSLEHSVWLTMMRDRLVQIRNLLAPDGSVWVHLDDYEQHRARGVLDEVFGLDRFVGTIVWQKRYSRENRPAIGAVHDYIHIYAPSGGRWKDFRNRIQRAASKEYTNPNNDPKGPWRVVPMTAQGFRANQMYPILTPGGAVHVPHKGRCWSCVEATYQQMLAEGRIYFGQDGNAQPGIIRYLADDEGLVPWTWWPHEEVGHNDEAKKEILDLFPALEAFGTPKPERLLARIVAIASNPGDIVLDCFAGSGTTAAVSQKMGRRWITVESSRQTIEDFAEPRLRMVVEGLDSGGVTSVDLPTGVGLPDGVKPGAAKAASSVLRRMWKAGLLAEVDGLGDSEVDALVKALRDCEKTERESNWEGGGGFRVLDVAPSMFEVIEGRVVLADWATGGALAEAVAAQAGFGFHEDAPFSGGKGRQRLAVIDGLVSEDVIRLLLPWLAVGELLTVYGTAVDPACKAVLSDLRRGSVVKRIPQSVLDDYRRRGARTDGLDWPSLAALAPKNEPVAAGAVS